MNFVSTCVPINNAFFQRKSISRIYENKLFMTELEPFSCPFLSSLLEMKYNWAAVKNIDFSILSLYKMLCAKLSKNDYRYYTLYLDWFVKVGTYKYIVLMLVKKTLPMFLYTVMVYSYNSTSFLWKIKPMILLTTYSVSRYSQVKSY